MWSELLRSYRDLTALNRVPWTLTHTHRASPTGCYKMLQHTCWVVGQTPMNPQPPCRRYKGVSGYEWHQTKRANHWPWAQGALMSCALTDTLMVELGVMDKLWLPQKKNRSGRHSSQANAPLLVLYCCCPGGCWSHYHPSPRGPLNCCLVHSWKQQQGTCLRSGDAEKKPSCSPG